METRKKPNVFLFFWHRRTNANESFILLFSDFRLIKNIGIESESSQALQIPIVDMYSKAKPNNSGKDADNEFKDRLFPKIKALPFLFEIRRNGTCKYNNEELSRCSKYDFK